MGCRVPRSLLLKQAIRLGKVEGPREAQLVSESMKDLKALFQPSASTQEDEDEDSGAKRRLLRSRLQAGELDTILVGRFGLNTKTLSLQTKRLVCEFPKLSQDQLELVQEGLDYHSSSLDWRQVPVFVQQLRYYIAYGSYGPRSQLPFVADLERPAIPRDFTFRCSSPVASTGAGQVVHRLSKGDLMDLGKVYAQGQSKLPVDKSTSTATGGVNRLSRFILLWATGVSLVAIADDLL
ncbi:hypothetical protein Kpol_461p9 [Vanderwaltozyma polyspora DSM 70294]|uniref:Uncharacterized protein n=1 Tax=Vanderwaltozyma polyspora (strain ATCC 22028 / DSM 70294 / BCRC 21397 / CBS 2163 / NBRC 10782 / NRRL Y-8283 / UCD 57-17) TaxID=436907 RepID=A7TR45_VANPO|nr:uncharacterized protein Kpol_461p9 [Vanderwaltozyma polyspora DSM 70294]EDO15255.1 hypothetical protein Kpol_461p9 [Vanderwaltozyma polyspora DSM 70294]